MQVENLTKQFIRDFKDTLHNEQLIKLLQRKFYSSGWFGHVNVLT